jgi:hypothetical protein
MNLPGIARETARADQQKWTVTKRRRPMPGPQQPTPVSGRVAAARVVALSASGDGFTKIVEDLSTMNTAASFRPVAFIEKFSTAQLR